MPNRSRKKKRPDINELAKSLVDEATSEEAPQESIEESPQDEATPEDTDKKPAAVALGRLGGLKGGKARAKKLTKKQRSESARKAALARWDKDKAP